MISAIFGILGLILVVDWVWGVAIDGRRMLR